MSTRASAAVVGVAVLAAIAASGAPAHAQEPIVANDFTIDVFTGPVLGASRIVGLGGAYTALGEGIDGAPWSPASYASRTLWELSWFEYDLAFSFLLPGVFSDNDFDNNGTAGFTYDQFVFLTFGLRLQLGEFGLGGLFQSQDYQIQLADRVTNVLLLTGHYGIAHMFFDGQLVVGLGARSVSLDVGNYVDFNGTGGEAGAVLRLGDQPWRLGVAARMPVESSKVSGPDVEVVLGTERAAGLIIPSGVHMPWEVQVGFAFQIGERPLNAYFANVNDDKDELRHERLLRRAERESEQVWSELQAEWRGTSPPPGWRHPPGTLRTARDRAWREIETARRREEDEELRARIDEETERRAWQVRHLSRLYLLVTTEVLITGPTDHGIGLEGFFAQQWQHAGEEVTLGYRLGLEGEPWPSRIKLRIGGYLEPSRFQGVGYRVHGTGGFDLRLFSWDLFGLVDEFDVRAGATIDVAARYTDWGVSVGFWH